MQLPTWLDHAIYGTKKNYVVRYYDKRGTLKFERYFESKLMATCSADNWQMVKKGNSAQVVDLQEEK